jgi:putative transposase
MGEHRSRITRTSGMNPWRAGCGESCTSGSEGGLGKPAGGNSGTAPQSDPYTEHPTREGKVYCCAVLDLFSRKVVGWAIDRRYEATLVNDALSMAAETRSPSLGSVIHSDHGTQFTSWAFTENVRRLGLLGSMGTVGDCYDNAPMESFWGSMQIELLNRQKWFTVVELSTAMADYIENFYNPARRHSSISYLTPDECEALHLSETQA